MYRYLRQAILNSKKDFNGANYLQFKSEMRALFNDRQMFIYAP